MLRACWSSDAALLLVPVSPCKVWRGSLARNPGLVLRARSTESIVSRGSRRSARACRLLPRGCGVDVIVERPAALDVHNATVMACVRLPGEGRRRVEHVAEFQATVRGLLALRDWLQAHRVDRVAMEATGVYWKPVWAVLEDRFDCLLVNARHVKQVALV